MNVAIIPARGGSRRIPRKNIRLFHGKPIIAYSIEAAKATQRFERIIVSTDDDEIAEISKSCGAEIFRRKKDNGLRGTFNVVCEAVEGMDFDYVCCIYATAPMMSPYDIVSGHLRINDVSHAISICSDPLYDAAQFYWSSRNAVDNELPYWKSMTIGIDIDPKRICDINTEEDWIRAEKMYAGIK